jgi:hypothetical protein
MRLRAESKLQIPVNAEHRKRFQAIIASNCVVNAMRGPPPLLTATQRLPEDVSEAFPT